MKQRTKPDNEMEWKAAIHELDALTAEQRHTVVNTYKILYDGLYDTVALRRALDKHRKLFEAEALSKRLDDAAEEYEDITKGEEIWASMLTSSES